MLTSTDMPGVACTTVTGGVGRGRGAEEVAVEGVGPSTAGAPASDRSRATSAGRDIVIENPLV